MIGEPGQGVGDAFFLGRPDPSLAEMVQLEGRANVPSIDAMRRPRAKIGWLIV